MDSPADEVLSTSLLGKAPDDVRVLMDESVPLPAGVRFFEERQSSGSVMKTWILGGGLMVAGILIALFGIYVLAHDDTIHGNNSMDYKIVFVGGTFLFAGVVVIKSIPQKLTLARAQKHGRVTRHGIFLTPERLISRNDFDVTIIPRSKFRGVEGVAVRYELRGETKSFNLPSSLVGRTTEELAQAIREWAAAAQG
jgi:hypothetical protein